MKKLSLCLVFIYLSLLVWSQASDVKIVNGPEVEAKRSTMGQVLGVVDGNVLITRNEKKKTFIESLDENARVVNSVLLLDRKVGKEKFGLSGGFVLKGRLFLKFSSYDKKQVTVITEEYDPQSLVSIKEISKETISMEGRKAIYWYGVGVSRAINESNENGFDLSNEEHFVLDYMSSFDKDKKSNENITISVYDENYEKVWREDFEIPYANDKFTIVNVIVDDFGNAHLLGKEYLDGKKKAKRGESAYKYHVMSFTDNGKTVKDHELFVNSKILTDAGIGINAEGKIVATGFYSNNSYSNIDGAFSMVIDLKTKNVENTSLKEFEKEFIQMGMTDKQKKKQDKKESKGEDLEMPEFDLDRIILTPDGGWILLAEQFYITVHTYTTTGPNGSTSTRTVIVYHFDDIIAVKMNPKGDIEWNVKVNKSSASSGVTSTLSYTWGFCGDELVLVYNTSLRKGSTVEISRVSAKGELKSEVLMENEKDELVLHPAYSRKVNDCKMMLYSARKKVYQFSFLLTE
jgi:hypothetical protein